MNKEVGGNEETQGLLLENRDEEKDRKYIELFTMYNTPPSKRL